MKDQDRKIGTEKDLDPEKEERNDRNRENEVRIHRGTCLIYNNLLDLFKKTSEERRAMIESWNKEEEEKGNPRIEEKKE